MTRATQWGEGCLERVFLARVFLFQGIFTPKGGYKSAVSAGNSHSTKTTPTNNTHNMTSMEDFVEHKVQVIAHIRRMHSFDTYAQEFSRYSSQEIFDRKFAQLCCWGGVLLGWEMWKSEFDHDPVFERHLRWNVTMLRRNTLFLLSCEDCIERWKRVLEGLDDGSGVCATCAAHAQ